MTARRACVVGWPARHSRSPKLHGHWLERYGIDGAYRAEDVSPEEFPAFIGNLARHGYVGCNVTMPHKEAAFRLADPDERAVAVGAANTLWLENGHLRATNTDVEGALHALDQASPGWDRRTSSAVVLGAGGASNAVVYGLIERGVRTVHVANRTPDKARALRQRFGASVIAHPWDDLPRVLDGAALLVNTTSLGMAGHDPLDLDLGALDRNAVVFDTVYVPLRTGLLQRAEARGLATANGLDMLLHQAVGGFELWFGRRPEVTPELFDLLACDIDRA